MLHYTNSVRDVDIATRQAIARIHDTIDKLKYNISDLDIRDVARELLEPPSQQLTVGLVVTTKLPVTYVCASFVGTAKPRVDCLLSGSNRNLTLWNDSSSLNQTWPESLHSCLI